VHESWGLARGQTPSLDGGKKSSKKFKVPPQNNFSHAPGMSHEHQESIAH